MLKILAKTLPVLLLVMASEVFAQKTQTIRMADGSEILSFTPSGKIICQAGTQDMPMIPLPESLKNKINSRVKTSVFDVTYTGFTTEAESAFQFAVDIWASIFSSEVPIRISANYTVLEDPNTLGSTSPGTFFANFRNAPKINTWYQSPIAEKIAGDTLNGPSDFDIIIQFNSTSNWYFDTSNPMGIEGTGQTDFATVVLHELGHAIGFSAFANVDDDGNGSIRLGNQGIPMAYSRFLTTLDGESLVDDLPDGGKVMGDALTSDGLRFSGPTSSVRVYAPAEYNGGSSISHTDQIVGELMNPFLGPNGFIHNPGRALGIMNDYGWEFTYMMHEPLESTENFDQSFDIVAEVFADDGYDSATLQLHYSIDAFLTDTVKVDMQPTGETNMFSSTIPNPGQGTIYSYYLTVKDSDGRRFTNPGEAPDDRFFQFIAAVDDSIPEISHSPLDFLLPAESEMKIIASITDFFTGVDTAYVEWFINDVEQEPVGMIQDPEFPAGWEGTLSFTSEFQITDIVKYQIVAIDKANSPMTAIAPEVDGFYIIPIEGIPDAVTAYTNDFNSTSSDFLGEKFSIETPNGFSDGALHSVHPYEEAGEGNEIQYISQLRVPIIIDGNNSIMEFDEIVLVEPGTDGALFGQDEFWDYVIAEGSNNDGGTWVALHPGYDSQDDAAWLQRYNGGIQGQISNAVGDPGLYKTRTIDLLKSSGFKSGETILIRFRLFSDPFAVGWGWAIDNLEIQGEKEVTAISDYLDPENDFSIYPNPSGTGLYNIDASFSKPIPGIQFKIIDTMGRIVQYHELSPGGRAFSYQLDLSEQPPGIYLINTSIGNDHLTKRLVKSN